MLLQVTTFGKLFTHTQTLELFYPRILFVVVVVGREISATAMLLMGYGTPSLVLY